MIESKIFQKSNGLWDWIIFNNENKKSIGNTNEFKSKKDAKENLNSFLGYWIKKEYLFFT